MIRALVLVFVLGTITLAFPAHAQPAIGISTQFIYSKNLTTGDGLPIVNGHGVSAVYLFEGGWVAGAEAGFYTRTTQFDPVPFLNLVGTKRLSNGFVLGTNLVGKYEPASGDKIVTVAISPTFPVTKGVTLILPIGPSYNFNKDVWTLGFSVKFSLRVF